MNWFKGRRGVDPVPAPVDPLPDQWRIYFEFDCSEPGCTSRDNWFTLVGTSRDEAEEVLAKWQAGLDESLTFHSRVTGEEHTFHIRNMHNLRIMPMAEAI